MSRRGKTYRRVAFELLHQAEDLIDNGRALAELEGAGSTEGLVRQRAGWIVSDVAKCMLMETSHRSTMKRIRQLGKRIRELAREQRAGTPEGRERPQ